MAYCKSICYYYSRRKKIYERRDFSLQRMGQEWRTFLEQAFDNNKQYENLSNILMQCEFDIENKQPILASIIVVKSTGLPNEGFFEMCDTLGIDAYLSDLQKECFEWWRK